MRADLIDFKCDSCGGRKFVKQADGTYACEYCGNEYELEPPEQPVTTQAAPEQPKRLSNYGQAAIVLSVAALALTPTVLFTMPACIAAIGCGVKAIRSGDKAVMLSACMIMAAVLFAIEAILLGYIVLLIE